MTNEEKAKELKLREIPNEKFDTAIDYEGLERCLIELAEWKDRQFKEYLEKVIETIRNSKTPQIEPLINAMIEWIKK